MDTVSARYLLVLPALFLAFWGFERFTSGGELEPVDVAAEHIQNGAPVVDARTRQEYNQGHIAGAIHANVLSRSFRAAVDGLDRDAPVYVYCKSGHRSGRAASVLEEMGFARVVNVGGIGALERAGLEVVR